jgi:hypothetical protein
MNASRIVPICALLISVIACIASLYQLRMASSSISAQTWPYVTIGWQHANDKIGIVVDNDGLGPALIRNVVLSVDQRPQRDVISAVRQIIGDSEVEFNMDAFTRGLVIRAGNSLKLFHVRGATSANQLRAAQSRMNLQICYCSILGRCWTNSLAEVIPQSVSECAENDANGLLLPEH